MPAGLASVSPEAALPVFNVNLNVQRGSVAPVIEELAFHIKRQLPRPSPAPAWLSSLQEHLCRVAAIVTRWRRGRRRCS